MKKIKLIALPLVAALCLGGAACTKNGADQAPEITGVVDRMCAVGAVCDLIDGVAALDREDGDITPSMEITVDGETVGFYATFNEEKDYEVKYKVADSKGHITETTATVSAIARDEYKKFDLVDFGGFEVKTSGAAILSSQSVIGDGAASLYTFKVSNAAADTDAVFTRTYKLKSGTDYTVKYYVKSNVAGTAKAKINDGEPVDLEVIEGDNVFTLTYSVPEGEAEETDVKIDILFGGLGANIEWTFDKAVAEHVAETVSKPLAEEITLVKGTNVHDRFDGTSGEVTVAEDGKSATLKINSASADKWRGGMFINTGLALSAGTKYTVSYDLTAEKTGFGVALENKQWDAKRYGYASIENEDDFHQENEITPNENGGLWLYVESGDSVNEITISNLKVTGGSQSGTGTQTVSETFTCANTFKMFAANGAPNYVQWVDGKLIYEVEKFGDTDWHNKIEGPQFFVDTSGVEFMISFRAKATAPVLCTWVGPKSGGWDPNLIWQQFKLSETERVYTFKGNESDMSNHQFEWQFGFASNMKYENVKIEISDIVIYWQNGILDD